MTSQGDFSAEKAYPGRSHTLDDAETSGPVPFNNAMSPAGRGRGAVEYLSPDHDNSTQDMSNLGNYKSAQKIRLTKKQAAESQPFGMSATIHTTADALPNVKGATRSKRTIN